MVNCNPETVSTDYDTSDRLFFEPLTLEDVLDVCDACRSGAGELDRGHRRARRADAAEAARTARSGGHPRARHQPDSIDLAEDRERFNALCEKLGIPQPPGGTAATHRRGAVAIARRLGYPVLVRPSYVLGGRAMQIVYDDEEPRGAMAELATDGFARTRGRSVGPASGARSTGSSRTRSRSTSTRSATPPARSSSVA